VSLYQKGKAHLDFTEARDSEWQWHQLVHMQVCTSLQTDDHASTPSLSFLQAGCPSCRPSNSVKALKALELEQCYCISVLLQKTMMLIRWSDMPLYTSEKFYCVRQRPNASFAGLGGDGKKLVWGWV